MRSSLRALASVPRSTAPTARPGAMWLSGLSGSVMGGTQHLGPSAHWRRKPRGRVAFSRGLSTKLRSNEPSEPVFHAGEAPSFAFSFDIDGVLLHGAKPIPGARESLKYLQDNNIPFILLTNGGGKPERDRVSDLSSRLGVELTVDNFVQSHTPFQELVGGPKGLGDKTVFVSGADVQKCRDIAHSYGFKCVVTAADILRDYPEIWPFEPLLESVYGAGARPLPRPLHTGDHMHDDTALKIDAMLVFSDPRDWALDIQIMVDLLLSRQGVLGTYSAKNGDRSLPNDGWQQDGQPLVVFSNADLFWSTTYHHPRFGQGAFQAALDGVWRKVTGGRELVRTSFGKPSAETYRFAERMLNEHRTKILGRGREMAPLRRVYMVGDNPESDIRGANEFASPQGTEWTSVLVRTGVWRPERGEPVHKPKMLVDDVKAAVQWALKREGH